MSEVTDMKQIRLFAFEKKIYISAQKKNHQHFVTAMENSKEPNQCRSMKIRIMIGYHTE
jgi:hypothetical protein